MRPNLVSSERKIKRPLLVSRSPRERLPFIANLELPVCDDAAVEGRTALTRLPIDPHYRDAELLRLVGQVAADPIARDTRTPTGIASSIWSLRLKSGGSLCLAQSG